LLRSLLQRPKTCKKKGTRSACKAALSKQKEAFSASSLCTHPHHHAATPARLSPQGSTTLKVTLEGGRRPDRRRGNRGVRQRGAGAGVGLADSAARLGRPPVRRGRPHNTRHINMIIARGRTHGGELNV